ncbi:MAG: hypothetical protein KDB88_05270, partial [Flavobacteriales bacterium]|nr:hypothetical protein [Flavobacteriales bacterium]
SAQVVTGPNAGTNNTITRCSNGSPFSMTAQLGGSPEAGGEWRTPGGVVHGPTFDPVVDPPGAWTYTVSGPSPCPDSVATLTISLVAAPQAGGDGAATLCSTSSSVQLSTYLTGTVDPGGSWTDPNGDPHSGTFIPATDPPGGYVYTVQGMTPCLAASATVTVTLNQQPTAGTGGTEEVCSNDPPFDLLGVLISPGPGGTWTGPGGPSSSTYTPGTSAPGNYTYTIVGLAPCINSSATVIVDQTTAPDAGTNSSIVICSDEAPFDLIDELGGTPDAGGQWFAPGNVAHGPQFDPAVDPGGVWTYQVPGQAPCADASVTLTITKRIAPNAGTNATKQVCSDDPSFQLLGELGGDPDANGTWVGPGGPSNGTFIPGTSQPGTYTYTVAGQSPCDPAVATVQVSVSQAPDAGTNNTLLICSDEVPFAMVDELGGTPDGNGSWTDPDGDPHPGTFDPATDEEGVYTYVVVGAAPCVDALATLTINVNQAPDAGASAQVDVCSVDAPFALLDALGGDPDATGTWTDPNGDPYPSGFFDPGSGTPGTYTYTVVGIAPCSDAQSTVEVDVIQAPNAGNNASLTVCSSDPSIDLFTVLGGSPDAGGNWTGPMGVHSGTYLPASQMGGTYTYTVAGTAPCANDQATVQITRQVQPRAGTDGTITVCSNNATFPLIAQLGGSPMTTGTWTDPNGSPVPSGNFTPGTSVPGNYRYIVAGISPCGNDTSFVQVNVVQAPSAGLNGNHTVCGNGASFVLFTRLGGTPDIGGVWSFMGPHGPVYDPAVDEPGVYTYTVAGIAPCANATSTVLVQEVAPANAGQDGSLIVCSSDAPVALISALGGTPSGNGTWTDDNSDPFSGTYDPAVNGSGTYTYTVVGNAPCPNASATVTVTENIAPEAGGAASLSICAGSGVVDLNTVLVAPFDGTGSWSDDDGTGQLAGSLFDPAGLAEDDYEFTYTVPGIGQCAADATTVTISIVAQLNAGSNTNRNICGSRSAYDLFAALNGSPDPGGTWTDGGTSAVTNGVFNATLVPAGTYVFTYTLTGTGGCSDDSSTLTVTVVAPRDPGLDNDTTICSNSGSFSMFPILGGTPQGGGSWLDQSLQPHSSTYDPNVDLPGTYGYRVSSIGPCPADTAFVAINEVEAPNGGLPTVVAVCSADAPFDMTQALNGSPVTTGTWTDPVPSPHSNIFDPASDPPGVYLYNVPGNAPCPNAVVPLTVNVEQEPFPGGDGDTTICSTGNAFLLGSVLSGGPQAGGVWRDPNGATVTELFFPGTSDEGTYHYVVEGSGECSADSSSVTVFVNQAPDAGDPVSVPWCASGGQLDLFAQLVGADNTGTWSDPNIAPHSGTFVPSTDPVGAYTYTVAGVAPCPSDVSTVTVSLSQPANAGANRTIQRCSDSSPFDLFAELGGSPEPGGSWTDPDQMGVSNLFFPGTSMPGTYTYTVVGDAPCPSASAAVTVFISQAVFAGNDATVEFCVPGPLTSLFPLLGGGAQPGGNWLTPAFTPHSGTFNPNVDLAGTYRYIRTAQAPCLNDTALVTVVLDNAPNAGNNAVTTVCDDEAPVNLFLLLGSGIDLNGTWTGPMGDPAFGFFTPGTDQPGGYVYRVNGDGACAMDSSIVTVFENHQPFAGGDGQAQLCESATSVDLFTFLNNSPETGGVWIAPDLSSFSGTFLPGTSQPGTYTYRIVGDPPCVTDEALVQVEVSDEVSAGVDAAVLICSNDLPIPLIDLLNGTPDPGGSWVGPGGPVPSGNYDPSILVSGPYTYTVLGNSPCPDRTATVQVTEIAAPNAGADGGLTVCLDDPNVVLFQGLMGSPQAGGTWLDVDGTGQLTNGVLNGTGLSEDEYRFTYVVAGQGPCENDSATVTVSVATALDAGNDTLAQVCESDDQVQLFALLGGTPQSGGSWTDVGGSGQLSGGVFDATAAGVGQWAFTYLLTASADCLSDSATLTVEVLEGPNAGCSGGITTCTNAAEVDLITSLTCNPDANGTWTDPNNMTHSGMLDPAVDPPGTYTYLVPGIGNCPDDLSVVNVTINQPANAGNNAQVDICSDDPQLNMFNLLGGADLGGSWSFNGDPHGPFYIPANDVTGLYVYQVQGPASCGLSVATVQVTEFEAVFAGLNAS